MSFKLICFDMGGVLIETANFWMELHKKFGTFEKGKILTDKYLHTDYNKLVEEVVVKLWKGKDAEPYYDLVKNFKYLKGVDLIFKKIKDSDYITAIVSASSIDVARRVQKDFGVDHIYANELIIKNGKVSGEFVWPVGQGKYEKARIVKDLAKDLKINLKEVIYIGDGNVDIEAFKIVGRSIAFNSNNEELKKVATYVVNSNNLADVLPYLD